jgi:hypothetical protein
VLLLQFVDTDPIVESAHTSNDNALSVLI